LLASFTAHMRTGARAYLLDVWQCAASTATACAAMRTAHVRVHRT
jgi:hypothetical protein